MAELDFYKKVQPKMKVEYSIESEFDAEADEITITITNFKSSFRKAKKVGSKNFVVPINHFIGDTSALKLNGNLILLT